MGLKRLSFTTIKFNSFQTNHNHLSKMRQALCDAAFPWLVVFQAPMETLKMELYLKITVPKTRIYCKIVYE